MSHYFKGAIFLCIVIMLFAAQFVQIGEAKTNSCYACLDHFQRNVGPPPNYILNGVAAVLANDVRAVGDYFDGSVYNPPPDKYLNGVAAVSANDVWAVGDYFDGSVYYPLIEHWNGSSWQIVSSPNPDPSSNNLASVVALSSSNVWAVGDYVGSGGPSYPLIEHWNGTKWSIVKSPNPGGSYFNSLYGIAAVSASNIWAVGDYGSTNYGATLVEHWNGSKWSVVTSPSPGSSANFLNGVAAISANDVWAVGGDYNGSTTKTLTEHWDGTSWSVVTSPSLDLFNQLHGVTAVSASNVWTVGASSYHHSNYQSRTLIEHWNGTKWSIVKGPNPGSYTDLLSGVTAVTANDIWAVGYYSNAEYKDKPLIEHWNGTQWSVVKSPNPLHSYSAHLVGVAAISTNDAWSVGTFYDRIGGETLVEHWNGTKWSIIFSQNTRTPALPLFK